MKKTIVILLSVLLLLPAFVLPCLAEPADEGEAADETAVIDYGESIDDVPLILDEVTPDAVSPSVPWDGSDPEVGRDDVIAYGASSVITTPRVVDQADLLTAEEELALSEKIAKIGAESSFDVVVVTVTDLQGKTAMSFADDYYDYGGYGYGENHDGCLLLIHMDEERGYWISTTGSGIDAINDDELDMIGDDIVPLFSAGDYYKGCVKFLDDVSTQVDSDDTIHLNLDIDVDLTTIGQNMPRVSDEANLFTAEEEMAMSEKITRIADEFTFDVVILTVTTLYNKTDKAFADDFYDYGGYGYGENHDGCLLLIHMDEDRGYWISTTGLGEDALSESDIERIGDDIVPSLSAGQYAAACDTFIDDVYEEVNVEINGRGFRPMLLIIGLVIGLVIALIVVGVLKGQLKSVRPKPSAGDYYVDGSLSLTGAYDVMVGHHVIRTQRESSSSSGSSTHTGSSGTSHGGGGGRF